MPQVNPKRTRYAINGSGGAAVVIRLTVWAKYVSIDEDTTANAGIAQGLQGYALSPFAQSTNILDHAEALPSGVSHYDFGDQFHMQSDTTTPLGNPGSAGNVDVPGGRATLGTPLVSLQSASVTATAVFVTEYA